MKDLVKNAAKLKGRAIKLLKDSGLIKILQKYGTVEIVGSYKYDLMTNNDIDIYVINQNVNRELAADALSKIIQKNYFRGYLFCNWVDNEPPFYFPKGYYIGLKYGGFDNRKWKIDIWFLPHPLPEIEGIDRLSDQQKESILKLKTKRDIQNLNISSYLIYRNVIEKGIQNIKEIAKEP